MKMKRLGILSLAMVMLLGLLAACSGNKEPNESSPTGSASATQTGESSQTPTPTPKKQLDLTIWNTQGTDVIAIEKPKEDIPGDWLAKKTGVRIKEFYGNGGQQWEAKLTTLIASDTLPNLVLTQSQQGPAHHAKLHEGNLNWELTPEMLQQYAPDVWKAIPQFVWDSIKVDGKIYGIPYNLMVDKEMDPSLSDEFLNTFSSPRDKVTWSGLTSNPMAIRDDILKKLIPSAKNYEELMKLIKDRQAPLGDDMVIPIKSTEEYIKFMNDIKGLGLKEGNKPVYAFGYDGGDNWLALAVLGPEMLGYKGYYYTGYMNIPQKKMELGYLNPVIKEAGRIQNQMINDNVIDPESLVHNNEKFKEKVMNGQYAIIVPGWVGGFQLVNDNLAKAGKPYRYVPFITEVPQLPEFPAFKEGPPTFIEALSLLKTIKEEDVPQVLGWINTMFTEEWEDVKFWGTKEAGLYNENADGTRTFKDPTMQKFLVDLDFSAMDWKDAKGLSFNNIPGGTPGFWTGVGKWTVGASKFYPPFFNKKITYSSIESALKFPVSSKWTQDFVAVPNIQSWSAEYANIPEIQKFWATRASWDDPFKVTLTAKNSEEYSKKWDAAVANLRKVIDVDKMLEEQTKIALPLLEKRSQQSK
ncbi:hypothetical protein [Cohnella silvisoli]|uniref:Extracellular solute-binding protein n=1 Tax=Cohnella silvisoli TaxID=2873699 RepID=A0ABV1L2M3_9BACL|nr:hypothetical protein [Cohnella silvisoli]MCD9021620.1 hypothetical protein [Cohnella silvisoli]